MDVPQLQAQLRARVEPIRETGYERLERVSVSVGRREQEKQVVLD